THIREVLLELATAHAVAHDVEEGEHAGFRSIDDALLEVLEIPPTRTPRVGDRRHSRSKCKAVGVDAVVARIGPLLSRAGVHVRVNVDETRYYVQARDIGRLRRVGCRNLRSDGGDFPGGDR